MAERDIILQAEHIFRTFSIKSGKKLSVQAVCDVSLTIHAGILVVRRMSITQ